MAAKIYFNVLAKDLDNAKAISRFMPDRTLVGVTVKDFATDDEAVQYIQAFMDAGVLASVGLGAGDPAMWQRVANVAVRTLPPHINQVYPAAGYTMGRLQQVHKGEFIVNSLIEPGPEPGLVYIGTGPRSSEKKDAVSVELAARLLADIGLPSVKFFPMGGLKKLEDLKALAKAAVAVGIPVIEPTGGIDLDNVQEIVQACLACGATTVIPHLYSSLIDKESGNTRPEDLETLSKMQW